MIEVMYDRWFVKYSKLDPERKEDLKTILIGLKNAESVIGNALSRQLNSEDLLRSLDELKVDNADQVKIAAVVNGFTPLISSAPTSAPIPPVNPALRPRTLVLPTRKTGTDKFPPVVKPIITLSDSTQEDEVVPIEMANGSVPPSKKKLATAEKETVASRLKSWIPWGKKEKEPVDEGVAEVNPPSNSSTAAATPAKKGNNFAKWMLIALAVFVLFSSVGAFFRLNSSPEDQATFSFDGPVPSSNDTLATGDTESCLLPNGNEGIKRYVLSPILTDTPNRGFANELMTVGNENTPALDPTKTYYAVKVGQSYLVATELNSTAYFRIEDFAVNPTFDCVESAAGGILTIQAEKVVDEPAVELVYRIDLGHWSGLMVTISLVAVFCFSLISLSYTGNGRWDLLLFAFATIGTAADSKVVSLILNYFRPLLPYLSVEAVRFVGYFVSVHFILVVSVSLAWAISAGSKSETRQFSEQYKAGSQFEVPKSYKPIFESLIKGMGFVGGFDFTMAIAFLAFFVVVGALDPMSSPFYLIFNNQILSMLFLAVLITSLAALETWRRGLPEDWKSFGISFLGLADFLLLLWVFGRYSPTFQDISSAAIAVILSLGLFVLVFGVNFWFQSEGERMELVRDRMADGMLLYSCMKLFSILGYIFLFILKLQVF